MMAKTSEHCLPWGVPRGEGNVGVKEESARPGARQGENLQGAPGDHTHLPGRWNSGGINPSTRLISSDPEGVNRGTGEAAAYPGIATKELLAPALRDQPQPAAPEFLRSSPWLFFAHQM